MEINTRVSGRIIRRMDVEFISTVQLMKYTTVNGKMAKGTGSAIILLNTAISFFFILFFFKLSLIIIYKVLRILGKGKEAWPRSTLIH